MHCELVVPALLASREIPRLPALELLLARGRAEHRDTGSLEDWLADAFAIDERPFAAGALSIHASGAENDRACLWMRADPVHLRLGHDRPTLVPAAGFGITQAEADHFAASLNAHFGGERTFVAVRPGQWCARPAFEGEFDSVAPLNLAGQAVDAQLREGRGAARRDAFLNEIQMALHDHPANLAREARGEPAVNSLWLWGFGKLPDSAHADWHSITTNEPLAEGLARLAGMRSMRLPAGAAEWLERAPEDGRHLILLEELRAALALGGDEAHAGRLAGLEARWFAPLLDALRAGRVGMVTFHVPDAGASWETVRTDLRRFWRRARPLGAFA